MSRQNHYDPDTRIYTHWTVRVKNPRLPEKFLPVSFATPDPLPVLKAGETAQRKEDDTAWLIVEDHRGHAWRTDDKSRVQITEVGPLPDGITHLEPGQYDNWVIDAWVKDAIAELDDLRTAAANDVRIAFGSSIEQPVPAYSTTWNGGMDSALAIDGAVRLAEQMGQTTITLFDSANVDHVVDIATGRTVAAAVAADYQTKLAHKQQLLRDIATATADQLSSLVWTDPQ